MSLLLSGDIGGSKTRLAMFEVGSTQVTIRHEQVFASQCYALEFSRFAAQRSAC